VATRVRYPAAYARQSVGVLLLPSTSRKYEEEVGATSLARSSFPSEPATVSVCPALLSRGRSKEYSHSGGHEDEGKNKLE